MTQFKTLSGKAAHIPSSGECPACGIKVDLRQVVLNGGALQQSKENPKSLYMSESLSGFLSLSLHSHNSNDKSRQIDLAQDAVNGQFELYFCSPKCVKDYLIAWVDEFEKNLSVAEDL